MTDDTRKPVEELSRRELDAAVAREVVGKTVCMEYEEGYDAEFCVKAKPYSTDIAAAWEVVEVLGGWDTDGVWPVWARQMERISIWTLPASEAPEAICRAALRAVREVDDE